MDIPFEFSTVSRNDFVLLCRAWTMLRGLCRQDGACRGVVSGMDAVYHLLSTTVPGTATSIRRRTFKIIS